MYNFEISDNLKGIMRKLSKKDKQLYEQLVKKINEIINNSDIEHYKNLKYDLKRLKRVHIGHFVLIFWFSENTGYFDDFNHHDYIYK